MGRTRAMMEWIYLTVSVMVTMVESASWPPPALFSLQLCLGTLHKLVALHEPDPVPRPERHHLPGQHLPGPLPPLQRLGPHHQDRAQELPGPRHSGGLWADHQGLAAGLRGEQGQAE